MLKLIGALVVTALLVPSAPAQTELAETVDGFASALAVAQAQVPGGQMFRSRLETRRGLTVFGFYFWYQGRVCEMEISKLGKIVKDTNKDGDPVSEDVSLLIELKKSGKAKLPEGRLLEIAGNALRNTNITDIYYERDGDKLILKVGNLTIDASTGRISSN